MASCYKCDDCKPNYHILPGKRPGTDFCHTNGKRPLPGKCPGRIPVASYGKCLGNPASHTCRKVSGSLTGCRIQLHEGVADDYLDHKISTSQLQSLLVMVLQPQAKCVKLLC